MRLFPGLALWWNCQQQRSPTRRYHLVVVIVNIIIIIIIIIRNDKGLGLCITSRRTNICATFELSVAKLPPGKAYWLRSLVKGWSGCDTCWYLSEHPFALGKPKQHQIEGALPLSMLCHLASNLPVLEISHIIHGCLREALCRSRTACLSNIWWAQCLEREGQNPLVIMPLKLVSACWVAPIITLMSMTNGGTVADKHASLGADVSSHQSAGTLVVRPDCKPFATSTNSGLAWTTPALTADAAPDLALTIAGCASPGWNTGAWELRACCRGGGSTAAASLAECGPFFDNNTLPRAVGLGAPRTFMLSTMSFIISSNNCSAFPRIPLTSTIQDPAFIARDGFWAFQSDTKPGLFTCSMSRCTPLLQSMSTPCRSPDVLSRVAANSAAVSGAGAADGTKALRFLPTRRGQATAAHRRAWLDPVGCRPWQSSNLTIRTTLQVHSPGALSWWHQLFSSPESRVSSKTLT